MSQEKPHYKRRQYLIKKEFQLQLILKFCLLLLIGVVLSTTILFMVSGDTLTTSFQHSRLMIRNTNIAILPSVIYTNLITLGLISIASAIVTLFVSHRIAGPLYRIEAEVKEIGEGDLTRKISLRKKDQTVALAESVNTMTASLHRKVREIRSGLQEVMADVEEDGQGAEVRSRLTTLASKLDTGFKLD